MRVYKSPTQQKPNMQKKSANINFNKNIAASRVSGKVTSQHVYNTHHNYQTQYDQHQHIFSLPISNQDYYLVSDVMKMDKRYSNGNSASGVSQNQFYQKQQSLQSQSSKNYINLKIRKDSVNSCSALKPNSSNSSNLATFSVFPFPYNFNTRIKDLTRFVHEQIHNNLVFLKSPNMHIDYILSLKEFSVEKLADSLLQGRAGRAASGQSREQHRDRGKTQQSRTSSSSKQYQKFQQIPEIQIIYSEFSSLNPSPSSLNSNPNPLHNFQLIKCVGSGGFSKVYLVRGYGRLMALKVINKQYILSNDKSNIVNNQKAILMQCSNHPFVTTLHSSFQTQNFLCFAMQFCNGGELFNLLRKVKKMSEHNARFYFLQTLTAIVYLHEKGIVYRDIKPQNIIIDWQGHVRLADYGLSKVLVRGCGQWRQSQIQNNQNQPFSQILLNENNNDIQRDSKTYSFCGSAQYMAPEMLLKQGHSFQIDFYCLGALLYELVIGLPPYYSRDQKELFSNIINNDLQFPHHVHISDRLKSFLSRMLEKDISKRYRSINEIMSDPWLQNVDLQSVVDLKLQAPYKTDMFGYNFDDSDFAQEERQMDEMLQRQKEEINGLAQDEVMFQGFGYESKQIMDLRKVIERAGDGVQSNKTSNNGTVKRRQEQESVSNTDETITGKFPSLQTSSGMFTKSPNQNQRTKTYQLGSAAVVSPLSVERVLGGGVREQVQQGGINSSVNSSSSFKATSSNNPQYSSQPQNRKEASSVSQSLQSSHRLLSPLSSAITKGLDGQDSGSGSKSSSSMILSPSQASPAASPPSSFIQQRQQQRQKQRQQQRRLVENNRRSTSKNGSRISGLGLDSGQQRSSIILISPRQHQQQPHSQIIHSPNSNIHSSSHLQNDLNQQNNSSSAYVSNSSLRTFSRPQPRRQSSTSSNHSNNVKGIELSRNMNRNLSNLSNLSNDSGAHHGNSRSSKHILSPSPNSKLTIVGNVNTGIGNPLSPRNIGQIRSSRQPIRRRQRQGGSSPSRLQLNEYRSSELIAKATSATRRHNRGQSPLAGNGIYTSPRISENNGNNSNNIYTQKPFFRPVVAGHSNSSGKFYNISHTSYRNNSVSNNKVNENNISGTIINQNDLSHRHGQRNGSGHVNGINYGNNLYQQQQQQQSQQQQRINYYLNNQNQQSQQSHQSQQQQNQQNNFQNSSSSLQKNPHHHQYHSKSVSNVRPNYRVGGSGIQYINNSDLRQNSYQQNQRNSGGIYNQPYQKPQSSQQLSRRSPTTDHLTNFTSTTPKISRNYSVDRIKDIYSNHLSGRYYQPPQLHQYGGEAGRNHIRGIQSGIVQPTLPTTTPTPTHSKNYYLDSLRGTTDRKQLNKVKKTSRGGLHCHGEKISVSLLNNMHYRQQGK